MKRAAPKHSHILQAYPRLDFEFLPTLAAAVLNRQECSVPVDFVGALGRGGPQRSYWMEKSRHSQTAATRKGLGKFLVIRSGSVDRNLMSTVMEIEKAIEKLPTDELFELTHWISSRFSDAWDRQIEIDIRSGRLDDLAAEALQEHRAGGSREFPLDEQ